VHVLPLALASFVAVAIAPAAVRALRDGGHVRPNWRGRELAFPLGVLPLASALLALAPVAAIARLDGEWLAGLVPHEVLVYLTGVALLGLIDDVFGGPSRGWRGHGGALLAGRLSTGVLKAGGSLGLALYVLGRLGVSDGRWLLSSAVLVLATNAFNLLDLRPGRAVKAFVLLGAGLTLGAWDLWPLWKLGLFAGPAVVAGGYDLREKAMLGDTGSNLLGGLAGLWLVLTLSTPGQLAALGLLVLITVYGELRSISAFVERTPGLRELDSWGRP
jgi:UDP-N-acetylmuramyl pentapeptide phosphotransferase/UDP-N-acetylglucosamine-1-phosphate transferase